jgi:hypothetical protein
VPLIPGKPYTVTFTQTIHDGPALVNDWALAGQLHQSDAIKGDSRSPPFGLYLTMENGQEYHVITVRTSPSAPNVAPVEYRVGKVPVIRDKPRLWQFTYIDGSGGPGLLVAYCDGELVAAYQGVTGYVGDACYWKEGFYGADEAVGKKPLPAGWWIRVSYSGLSIKASR